jgi:hypothetical protein
MYSVNMGRSGFCGVGIKKTLYSIPYISSHCILSGILFGILHGIQFSIQSGIQ